jgi:hypothetical protein
MRTQYINSDSSDGASRLAATHVSCDETQGMARSKDKCQIQVVRIYNLSLLSIHGMAPMAGHACRFENHSRCRTFLVGHRSMHRFCLPLVRPSVQPRTAPHRPPCRGPPPRSSSPLLSPPSHSAHGFCTLRSLPTPPVEEGTNSRKVTGQCPAFASEDIKST